MNTRRQAILQAILAAVCYGVSVPVSKILLTGIPPVLMAALLYLGAGIGMTVINLFGSRQTKEAKISKKDLPYTAGMVVLDIAAPIFLMLGLTLTTSANASLINNFEIVATAVIALAVFKETITKRMWLAIALITVSGIILSIEDFSSFHFSAGSILVLLACVCWGLENNCTRMLSIKDPSQIVIIKGFGSGLGSLFIALMLSEFTQNINVGYVGFALLLGFASYGLSIFLYIYAQRQLGAARTGAYYAFAPFVGVGLSFLIFRQDITLPFMIALAVMLAGTCLAAFEKHEHRHTHEMLEHEHRHSHADGHHNHTHDTAIEGEHSHFHIHDAITHSHKHTPDLHHFH